MFKDLFIGAVIGAANIIPGVSGGTMALVLGVYERLLTILSSVSFASVKALLGVLTFTGPARKTFLDEFNRLEGFFLIKIVSGALLSIALLASLMTYLLHTYHDPTYGFFFGLVLMSAIYPFKLIKHKNVVVFMMVAAGVISVMALANSVSNEDLLAKAEFKQQIKQQQAKMHRKKSAGELPLPADSGRKLSAYMYFLVLGAVAITAMVLPGVSGSFLLLLLGGYFDILAAIAGRDFLVLAAFALGCLIGLLASTRLIHFLLVRWHDATMGYLFGLVIGSLWMIWPFKTSAVIGDETIYLGNTIPVVLGSAQWLTLLCTGAGIALILLFLLVENKQQV